MADPVAAGTITVRLEDGSTHDVVNKIGDLIRFEREYGVSAAQLGKWSEANARVAKENESRPDEEQVDLPHEIKPEWMLYLAWLALRRKKLFDGGFDEFLDQVDDIGGGEEDEQPGEVEPGSAPGVPDPGLSVQPTPVPPPVS